MSIFGLDGDVKDEEHANERNDSGLTTKLSPLSASILKNHNQLKKIDKNKKKLFVLR
jgi:hypothetical protein